MGAVSSVGLWGFSTKEMIGLNYIESNRHLNVGFYSVEESHMQR